MGLGIITSHFSEISKTNYFFSSYTYHKLRLELNALSNFLCVGVSDYFDILSGYAFTSTDYVEDGIKLLRIGDISRNGEIVYDEMAVLPEDFETIYERFLVKENDIVIAMTGATIGKSGFVEKLSEKLLLNQRVGILRVKEGLPDNINNIKFFYYLTKTDVFQKQILINSMGKSQPNISPFDILKIRLPKVDYKKQNEVVKIFKTIEKEISKLQSQILHPLEIINEVFANEFGYSETLWKEFGKGMTAGTQKSDNKSMSSFKIGFNQVKSSNTLRFSTRVNNPLTQALTSILVNRPNLKLAKLINDIKKGIQPEYDPAGEIPVVKIANMKNGFIDLSEPEYVKQSFYESARKQSGIQYGDVLLCCTGKISIGKIDYYDLDQDAILTVDSYIIRVNENKVTPLFFTYFFRSILGAYQVERDFTGTTNQIHLYESQILGFTFPDLSLKKQESTVDKIKSSLDEQKAIEKQIQVKQDEIKQIIMECLKKS